MCLGIRSLGVFGLHRADPKTLRVRSGCGVIGTASSKGALFRSCLLGAVQPSRAEQSHGSLTKRQSL